MTVKYHPDMDPLEEIRAIKKEIYEKFRTVDAYFKYLEEKYPNGANPEKYIRPEDVDAYFARSNAETEEPAPRTVKRRKTASPAKPRGRGKSAKRLAPA